MRALLRDLAESVVLSAFLGAALVLIAQWWVA